MWMRTLGALLLAACGGGGSSGDAGSDHDGSSGELAPATTVACATPEITPGATIALTGAVPSLALARSESEAAVAYMLEVEQGGPVPVVQRLDLTGAALGAPVEIAPQIWPDDNEPIQLAGGGDGFVACWDGGDGFNARVECAAVTSSGAIAGYTSPAGTNVRRARLAHDGVAYLLVTGQGASYALRVLGPDGLESAAGGGGLYLGDGRVAARHPGFVLAASESVGSSPRSLRWAEIDSDGQPIGDGPGHVTGSELVTIGARGPAAALLLESSSVLEAMPLTADATPVALTSNNAPHPTSAALVAAVDSFAAAWVEYDGGSSLAKYRALDATATPTGDALSIDATAATLVGLTPVTDGFLAVTAHADELRVFHLGCP